jgi:hypothetical protein
MPVELLSLNHKGNKQGGGRTKLSLKVISATAVVHIFNPSYLGGRDRRIKV